MASSMHFMYANCQAPFIGGRIVAAQAPVKKNLSALKRVRQTEKRTLKNRSTKSMIKTLTKHIEHAVKDKNAEEAATALKKAVSAIDKAAGKKVLHRNTASRKVSRLSKIVNAMTPSQAV